MILSGLSLLVLLIGPSRALINTDWKTLNREVTLKYFSPDQYYFSQVSHSSQLTCTLTAHVSLILLPGSRGDLEGDGSQYHVPGRR